MNDEAEAKKALIEMLTEEVSRLLLADDVSDDEKLKRMQRALTMIETGKDGE